ncbi:PREDICTED: uncharacterized protein LOC107337767 [Acropora digitifera]|uniref:uncharacterized protein LOC107337767 n=1 Tax=Acropora digitifera TaxID=70779 RepID=UPI00077A8ABE|nr:PREDICTED: uncharacterized protein LOC107337767 [Acropora digitifera]
MAQFRWPKVENDIALLKEIVARRPSKADEWDDIVEFLSSLFSTENNPVVLNGRGCRERSELLIKKFKSEEPKALKRSGTEEEYDNLKSLLEDITTFLDDMPVVTVVKQKKKEEQDKAKGLAMRKAAMDTYNKNLYSATNSQGKEEDEELFSAGCSKKTKRGRTDSSQMLYYLSTKYENNMKVREGKLDLTERKLQLKEKRLALEEIKWNMMMTLYGNIQDDS